MKKGISLIVLVITIIVMIILASSVVITLSNTGVIDRASQAVDLTNENQVQDLASLIWADAYMNNKRGEILVTEVETKLEEQGITSDKWNVIVTDTGVSVTNKNFESGTGLGSLITAADYGKTINYEANGVTDWKVFYEDETNGYVYLIASEKLAADKIPAKLSEIEANGGAGVTILPVSADLEDGTTKTVGQIYWVDSSKVPTKAATIQNPTRWMANWSDNETNKNARCASYFLDETYWTAFKNERANYAAYVLGAIGTPTAEMFVASWNEKRLTETNTDKKKLALVSDETIGYYINDITTSDPASSNTIGQNIATTDSLYIWNTTSNASIWLASPSSGSTAYMLRVSYLGNVNGSGYNDQARGIRPVVCLKSSIPATVGTGDYDFELTK